MTGLVKLGKFAPSKTPYALHPRAWYVDNHGFIRVQAIWAGRKNGRTTASIGELSDLGSTTFEEFVENVDMRYGGEYEGRWDGERLITPQPVTPTRYKSLTSILIEVLGTFPKPAFNYEGWYYRK
jgi:hypothetical protein